MTAQAGTVRIVVALAATLLSAALLLSTASAARIDRDASRITFILKTRWGQTLHGRFPEFGGDVVTLPDGRQQVQFKLATRAVEILDSPRYTRLTRGRGFFDAQRHPQLEFVSEPYPSSLLRGGGALAGSLRIRGVEHPEVFTIEPADCAQPARTCDVVANGSIRRSDYGIDRWIFALSDQVRFTLRIRLRGGDDP